MGRRRTTQLRQWATSTGLSYCAAEARGLICALSGQQLAQSFRYTYSACLGAAQVTDIRLQRGMRPGRGRIRIRVLDQPVHRRHPAVPCGPHCPRAVRRFVAYASARRRRLEPSSASGPPLTWQRIGGTRWPSVKGSKNAI
jgi:hypothetical protein